MSFYVVVLFPFYLCNLQIFFLKLEVIFFTLNIQQLRNILHIYSTVSETIMDLTSVPLAIQKKKAVI